MSDAFCLEQNAHAGGFFTPSARKRNQYIPSLGKPGSQPAGQEQAVNGMNPDKEPEKKKAKALEELAKEEAAQVAMADSKKQEEEERASCEDWD